MPFPARSRVGPPRAASYDLLVESGILRHFLKQDVFFWSQVIIKYHILVEYGTSLFVYKDNKIALRILMKIGAKLSAWATETFLCNIDSFKIEYLTFLT